jgi:hypothetical protein
MNQTAEIGVAIHDSDRNPQKTNCIQILPQLKFVIAFSQDVNRFLNIRQDHRQ